MYGALYMARETDYWHGFGGARIPRIIFRGGICPLPPRAAVPATLGKVLNKIIDKLTFD